ncbi:hypothetical protein ALO90_200184 [Pseudomonas amygdali pv. aesculi]|nr:hypothetical protein ALO90_200184 [Pseudomonas amygdali pv. aesculi]
MLTMQFSLPNRIFQIPLKVLWGLTIAIQGKMFVVQPNCWVIEVRVVLAVGCGGGLMFVRAFVDILNSVVVQPVGNHALFQAFDRVAQQRDEAARLGAGLWGHFHRLEGWKIPTEHEPKQIPLTAECNRAVLQSINKLSQLLKCQLFLDHPIGNTWFLSGRVANDGKAQPMEGLRTNLDSIHSEALERLLRSLGQLFCCVLVERQHHDFFGLKKATVNGVSSLRNHGGSLARPCGSRHLNTVIEANNRLGLLVVQRALFHVREQLAGGDPLSLGMRFVLHYPVSCPVLSKGIQ